MMEELIGYDAIALGGVIRKGEISPLESLDITTENTRDSLP
jgi:hypothetical protein